MNRTLLRGLLNVKRTLFANLSRPFILLRGLLFGRGRGGAVYLLKVGGSVLLKVVLRVRFRLRVFYLDLKVSFLIDFFAIEAPHVI